MMMMICRLDIGLIILQRQQVNQMRMPVYAEQTVCVTLSLGLGRINGSTDLRNMCASRQQRDCHRAAMLTFRLMVKPHCWHFAVCTVIVAAAVVDAVDRIARVSHY